MCNIQPLSMILPHPYRQKHATMKALHGSRTRGFTLIEIIVAIAILAILTALIVPRVVGKVDDAAIARARSDVQALTTALSLYKLDNHYYPSTEQSLEALLDKPGGPPEPTNWKKYLDKLPKDPWGRPYQYISPGSHGDIDVYSLGKDGQVGGEGIDADFGNWE